MVSGFLLLQNVMLLCNVRLYPLSVVYSLWLCHIHLGLVSKMDTTYIYTCLKEKPNPPTVQARGEQHPHVTKHKIQVVTLSAASGSSKLTNPKPRDLPVPSYMTCNRTGCWLEENVTNMQRHHAISIIPHLIPNKHLYTLL